MTPDEQEHTPLEEDHTGIRALLRALPDPGPMPDDLVNRIQARLDVEQTHRSAPRPAPHRLATHGDSIIDLAAERSHRRPGRTVALLGAAAAGLVVATVAISQVLGGNAPLADSTASVQTPQQRQATAEEGGQEAGAAAADAGGGSDDAAADAAAETHEANHLDEAMGAVRLPVALVSDLGEISADTSFSTRLLRAATSPAPAGGATNLTAAQANSCFAAVVGQDDWESYYAAPATSKGQPVVALVALDAEDAGRAWLMPGACVTDRDQQPLLETTIQP